MNDKQLYLPKEKIEYVSSLYSKGKFQEAIDNIKALNESYPNESLLFNLIGACYKEMNQLEGAAKMFGISISIRPNYAEAHFNLGVVLKDLGQIDAAIESYKKAITISPNYSDAHNNLGNIFLDLGLYKDAIESFEWAVAYQHDLAEAHNNLGNALNDCGRVEEAIESFKKALLYKPNYEKAYFNLALTYKDLGNEKDFLKNILKALDLKPDWGHAHYHLSRIKKYKKNDHQVDQMHIFLEGADMTSTDRIGFNFALAKAYEDLENYDEQFKFLNEANSIRKKELNYVIDKDKKLFSRIKEPFKSPPSILQKSLCKDTSVRPIFIVGMPRSGTSLVHQIIDSHNKVNGVGELNNLNKIILPFLKNYHKEDKKELLENHLLYIRQQYLDSLSSLNIKEKIIIDKMPLNFRYIGFILSSFPEAKIIHMNRNPIATCWSIYKYEFRGNAYSFNQEDIVSYFALYKELMSFWSKLFPNKIYDICYEDLTSDQEEETRKLLEYCELDWDENCLNFHTNKTAVKTTSSMQVRQKMYQGSSEVWKKYEAYLQPLIKGLSHY